MDIWTKKKRSKVMSRIRSKNTKPEIILRSLLHKEGYRFRIHRKDLPGKPDIVFPSKKIAIYVHGCFWHFHKHCPEGRVPKTNSKFWSDKLQKNISRDRKHLREIKKHSWLALVFWECEIENKPEKVMKEIIRMFNSVPEGSPPTDR